MLFCVLYVNFLFSHIATFGLVISHIIFLSGDEFAQNY